MSSMTFKLVLDAVTTNAAAFRCRRTLQPAGGPGTKVFPPTYMGAVYATEQRRIPGRDEPVLCVLLDSVQSQSKSNGRVATASHRIRRKTGSCRSLRSIFSDADLVEPIDKITSASKYHTVSPTQFFATVNTRASSSVSPKSARRLTPPDRQMRRRSTSFVPPLLIFGMWDSTGPKGVGWG